MQQVLGSFPELTAAWHENQPFLWRLRARLAQRGDYIFAGRPTFVYFVDSDRGPIKIGAAANPRNRLSGLQVGSPHPLRLIAYCQGTVELERFLHAEFAADRLDGEWFRRTPEILATASELTGVEEMRREIEFYDEEAGLEDVRQMFLDKCLEMVERFFGPVPADLPSCDTREGAARG